MGSLIRQGTQPLPVRDAAEIRRYLTVLGLDPALARARRLADGSELWAVPRWDGPEVTLVFQVTGDAGPSRVLDPGDLHDLALRYVRAIPTRPELLGPAYLERVLAHLAAASEARAEIRRFLPAGAPSVPATAFHQPGIDLSWFTREALDRTDAMLRTLAQDMVAAASGLQVMTAEATFVPAGSFLLPDAARGLLPAAPAPVEALGPLLEAGWGLIDDQVNATPVGLLRHPDGAVLEVIVEDDARIVATRLIEGPGALVAWVRHGLVLTDDARLAVLVQVARGRAVTEAMTALVGAHAIDVRGMAKLDAGNGRTHRVFLVDQRQPRRRSAVLAVISDADDRILGRHLLEGPGGYDQLSRVLRRVGLENAGDPALRALVRAEDAAESLRTVLGRYLDPSIDHATLTASLLPRPGDAARAFTADVAPALEAAAAELRRAPPAIVPGGGRTELSIDVAPVAALADGTASAFPGAYRELSRWLRPENLWATWCFHPPGDPKGMRYDGLVRLDDRWVWFPKPWRHLHHD